MKRRAKGLDQQGRYPDASDGGVEYGKLDDIIIALVFVLLFIVVINILV